MKKEGAIRNFVRRNYKLLKEKETFDTKMVFLIYCPLLSDRNRKEESA
jgi:hypothetical protein